MIRRSILGVALSAAGISAHAEGDHAIAAKVGVLGLGVEYAYTLNERVVFRAGVNGSEFRFDSTESGIDYEFDFAWDSLAVAVDFHPLRSPLRLTGGVLGNDNTLRAVSRPSEDVTIGGTIYTPAEVGTLRGEMTFDKTAPFVGVGWDWSRDKRLFGVSFDLGLVKQGTPVVTLGASGGLLDNAAFDADLAAERAELSESLDDFDLLPFATLGFVFRF
jgi:hypothetical protein